MLKKIVASGCLLFMLNSGISYATEPFSFNQTEIIQIQKKSSVEISLKKSDKSDLRRSIHEKALKETNAYLFGNYLDDMEKDLSLKLDQCTDSNSLINPNQSGNLEEKICNSNFNVPDNFLVKEMDFYGEVNKKELKFRLYQRFNGKNMLLLEASVALGGISKDYSTGVYRFFGTPSGEFYLERIVEEPWWYPPGWAKEKSPQKPGIKNAYGLWMAEFYKKDSSADYAFSYPHDAGFRIHSTNKPKSIGTYSSHGCIRLHPDVAAEMFPAIIHYTKHKEPQKNGRGTIYPLEKSIKIKIY